MKVLITTDLFKPSINGVVTSIMNLEKELEKQGLLQYLQIVLLIRKKMCIM